MREYCVRELRMSEDAAFKRIRAARAARKFPAIFEAVSDGQLSLSAVVQLAPYLSQENAVELLAAAANQTVEAIVKLLAERFPRPDLPTEVRSLAPPPTLEFSSDSVQSPEIPKPPQVSRELATWPVAGAVAPSTVRPLAPGRIALQVTISETTREKLRHAQDLLGHQVPSGDIAAVLDLALDALITRLEKRKFAATKQPRSKVRDATTARHVPAAVKRAVWQRDGGRCTFVGENGQRCPARKLLEFDHVEEVARGGRAAVAGMRLRCRAHNQYTAERTFGAEFMNAKRSAAARARARAAGDGANGRTKDSHIQATQVTEDRDVRPWLHALGFRGQKVHQAAEHCDTLDGALEDRVKAALSFLAPKCRHDPAPAGLDRGVQPMP